MNGIVWLLGLVYLVLFLRIRYRGKNISWWHLLSFGFGIALLCVGTAPSMMQWGHQDIRGHMVQHLLIAMYAPIFLVLGMPLKVTLLSVSPAVARWMMVILKSGAVRFLSHPFTALLLNIGGMYILYCTPLYQLSLERSLIHHAVHLHFFLAGYLFVWSLIGLEAIPRRPNIYVRLTAIFLSIALHAYLCKIMYIQLLPATGYADRLSGAVTCKSWYMDPLMDAGYDTASAKQEAAVMMYYGGDIAELIILVILFILWFYRKQPTVRRLTLFPN
ncbi:cytochrome c oxidase assembly protein [Sphingobacterium haloxyli]|uniref:Cytochrome c oxidase assembly protein n=1 Tax=Sphingobacterium haloxyli TaxID=2100533 RepID=A0A2S9IYK0_9SPHI|nr:cytochrome c oxidase assembly protein [Sphingobacterium haloxyli]PRD45560.1 cytochrome c oxidase assembly protein [Sphingobacterium haloxyli]